MPPSIDVYIYYISQHLEDNIRATRALFLTKHEDVNPLRSALLLVFPPAILLLGNEVISHGQRTGGSCSGSPWLGEDKTPLNRPKTILRLYIAYISCFLSVLDRISWVQNHIASNRNR